MGWVCSSCTERHTEAFDRCWRCGATRASAKPIDDGLIEPGYAPVPLERSPTAYAIEREALARRAEEIRAEAVANGDWPYGGGDRAAQMAAGLTRLRRGLACAQVRRRLPLAVPRRDLDFYWALSVGGAAVWTVGAVTWWSGLLGEVADGWAAITLTAVGAFAAVLGSHIAAGAEINAAREGGWLPPH